MAAGRAANPSRIRLTLPLWLLLSILTQAIGVQDPTPSTVSVFLPSYGPRDWAALRGSIISSDDAETTYTIFCAPDKSYGCNIGGGTLLPFTFAEGPSTYHYERTIDPTISISQACLLSDTTAATCSGSTSLGAITLGPLSGPSSTSVAPFTLTGELHLPPWPLTFSLPIRNRPSPSERDDSWRDGVARIGSLDISSLDISKAMPCQLYQLNPAPFPGTSIHWGILTLAEPPLTSTAGSLTFTYYGSETTGSAGTSVPTASDAIAKTADGESTTVSTTSSPSVQLQSTSGARKLGRRHGGCEYDLAVKLMASVVLVLLW